MLNETTYDYVIVGAGSVLAHRLTEDPGTRVLVLEAGGRDDDPRHAIPAAFPLLLDSEFNWGYRSVPQRALGRSLMVPRGKGYGGSSSMNAHIYIRGNRADYDSWRDDFGAAGWGWDDVLPYFKRAEGNSRLSGHLHNTEGPLRVQDPVYTHPLTTAWVDSAVAYGLARTDDFNGQSQMGVGPFQSTIDDGRRWSAADAYLRPALSRGNLTVRTHALATRVVLEGSRAVGVAFRDAAGVDVTVRAEAEVILSGGAINSPQLLMLSGIGPAAHLREKGIDVRADLPGVGSNLQEHFAVPYVVFVDTPDVAALVADPAAMDTYQRSRRGPFSSTFAEAGAFFSTAGDPHVPDIGLIGGSATFADGEPQPSSPTFSTLTSLLSPRSRGTVQLNSADPAEHPAIDLAAYEDPEDLNTMLAGYRRAIELVHSGPLAEHIRKPHIPGPIDAFKDAELAQVLRRWTQTTYHVTSTCAMGTSEDAVVDEDLRVRGIEGLRVVDASVMPKVPRGNTNAPTIMIAEKAADLLRQG